MVVGTRDVALPTSVEAAVRDEFRRVFKKPYDVPIAVLFNGLLLTGVWFLLPTSSLITLHGALAFPIILASWMYSDVPATNVLGADAERTYAALDNPEALWRMLVAKTLVLWSLVFPICLLVVLGIGSYEDKPVATLTTIGWIAIVPLGALGISAWVGIRFPYHPIALRLRWKDRRPYRHKIVRWTLLTIMPYIIIPYIAILVAIPSVIFWGLTSQEHGVHPIPDGNFAIGAILTCLTAIAAWLLGLRLAVRLALRRRAQLTEYLANPDMG
jgi:hypothetical protein